jgi:hypothetical protein
MSKFDKSGCVQLVYVLDTNFWVKAMFKIADIL